MNKEFQKLFILIVLSLFVSSNIILFDFSLEKKREEKNFFHNYYSKSTNDYKPIGKAEGNMKIDFKIYGGIVSHDIVATSETAKYFENIKNQKPKVVFLIGPDHYKWEGVIRLSKYDFRTPYGDLKTNKTLVEKIKNQVGAIIDEKTFDKEHSITAVVPFIKYYFPETEIVPIIIGEGTKRADIDNLAKTLKNIAPQDSIVLVSVDFSHYLSVEAAKFHDTKAIATIKSFDIDEIRKLEIDSRPAITVLLKYLQSQKAERMDYWNYSSALIKNDKYDNHVSSYLYAYFSEGERIYEPVVSFLNFGDAMFGRNVGEKIKKGLDPFLFIRGPQNTRLFFQGLDFITLNLEGPITENEKCQKKAYSFRFATTTGQLLKENGIFLVNLANNHSFDCYQTGLNDTKKFLTNSNVSYMGGGDLEKSYTEKHAGGKKIAFIGIDLSINSNFDLAYLELIKKLKKRNDYVVVNIHWGVEYNKEATKTQKDVGHKIIDAGADAIIGHHPHVIEPLEIYKGKPIFYSLGNFIFDQIGYEENRGIGAGIIFKNSSTTVQIFPYEITNHQPKLLLPEEAERFCGNFLKSLNVSTTTPCSFSI